MPKFNTILNLPGFSIKKVSGYQPLLLDIQYNRLPRCGHCESKRVRKKDSFMRTVKHETVGHRRTLLRFKAYKLYWHQCQRYSNQRFPGIGKYQRATERLKVQIYQQHTLGVSQKDLSHQFVLGTATIERWYQRQYELEDRESMNRLCPTVLGIDEHFFSRKQGFATTLCDLRKNKIFDIVKGRSEKDLAEYLQNLPGKERVKVIKMNNDVTAGYIIVDVERLRKPMQRITDYLLEVMAPEDSKQTVENSETTIID